MELRIAAVGQKMPAWVACGFRTYAERLPGHLPLRLVELPAGRARRGGDVERARRQEAQRLLTAAAGARIVVLDEGGRGLRTADVATRLDGWQHEARDVAFLIGGPDGLDATCRQRAELIWSLSPLTLPHMLVRVVLAEQLYRAWTLLRNHPYHRQ